MAQQNEVKFEEIKKPRVTAMNLGMVLGAKYFSERNTEEFHFGPLNIYHQILFDADHYCACDKYDGCRDEFFDRRYCPISRFKYCGEFTDFEERCDYEQFKFDELLKIASELFFIWRKCLRWLTTYTNYLVVSIAPIFETMWGLR